MRSLRSSMTSIAAIISLTACGGPDMMDDDLFVNDAEYAATQEQELCSRAVISTTAPTVYDNPYADGTANPAATLQARAGAAYTRSGLTYVALRVTGLPADRVFGAHVHKLACADTKGGTHYQNVPSPTTPTDPAYANAQNEVWLDFTTNAAGRALSVERANFLIRPTEAKSIVIHTQATGAGGVAGAKLACIDVPF
jgi:predicted small lipoprotein YifL